MTSRLFTTALDDTFDPARDVALGPWCYLGWEHLDPGWDERGFPTTFPDQTAIRVAAARCRGLAEEWVDRLQPEWEERHGERHSREYWRYLAFGWLATLLHTSWARYVHIRAFIARSGDRPFEVAVLRRPEPMHLADTGAFIESCCQEPYDFLVNSLILRKLAPPNWKLVEVDPWIEGEDKGPPPVPSRSVPTGYRRLLEWARDRGLRLSFEQIPGVGHLEWLFWSLVLNLMPRRSPLPPAVQEGSEPSADFPPLPPEFRAVVEELVALTMPRSLGDGYAALTERVRRRRTVPGRLFVGYINLGNDSDKAFTASAAEKGERVVHVQHGGMYGMAPVVAVACDTEYRHEAFLSWGWSRHGDYAGHFVPLPSPMLARFADRHRFRDRHVLFVGGVMRGRLQRLRTAPQSTEFLDYRRDKVTFIKALSPEVRESLVYRPYFRSHHQFLDQEYLEPRVGPLRILRGDLTEAMLGCRLLILDNPSTSLCQALAGNVPTISFWSPVYFPLTEEAAKVHDHLRRVGLFFDSPEEAAAQVSAIWDRVEDWWASPEIQEARRVWCSYFAATSGNWRWEWLIGLYRIATQRHIADGVREP